MQEHELKSGGGGGGGVGDELVAALEDEGVNELGIE